ncbi:MAG TPA: ankyrin repeat domain-containing protein [Candidatus Nitrosotenuis sp.]|nr:ankyrin repeat domain-containing protein [Candidatus Nitrosotenuis sp.]
MKIAAAVLLLALATPLGISATQSAPPKAPAAVASKEDALLAAIRKSDAEAVKSLIAQGVNVNHKFRYDRMALSFACDRGHLGIVKMLVDAGAEVNAKDSFYGATALDWALEKNNVEVAKLLLEKGAAGREQALAGAARQGSLAMVKMLLAMGGLKEESLSEALALAERGQHAEVVAALKEAGAKPLPKPDFVVDAETLAKYAGTYRSETPGAPELTFLVKDGKFFGVQSGQQFTLGAYDANNFTVLEVPGIRLTFKLDEKNMPTMHLKQGGFAADYKRVEAKQP